MCSSCSHYGRLTSRRLLNTFGAQGRTGLSAPRSPAALCAPIPTARAAKLLPRTAERLGLSPSTTTSDLGGLKKLTKAQIDYAASRRACTCTQLRDVLNQMLIREGRIELAQACFEFLPNPVAQLGLGNGWPETDIFLPQRMTTPS